MIEDLNKVLSVLTSTYSDWSADVTDSDRELINKILGDIQ